MLNIKIVGGIYEYKYGPTAEPSYVFSDVDISGGSFARICDYTILTQTQSRDTSAAHVKGIDDEIAEIEKEAAKKVNQLQQRRNDWLALPNSSSSAVSDDTPF